MNEIGIFIGQSVGYNIIETGIVVLGIAYWVWIIMISLEK